MELSFLEYCPCCGHKLGDNDTAAIADLGMCLRCKEYLERHTNWNNAVMNKLPEIPGYYGIDDDREFVQC